MYGAAIFGLLRGLAPSFDISQPALSLVAAGDDVRVVGPPLRVGLLLASLFGQLGHLDLGSGGTTLPAAGAAPTEPGGERMVALCGGRDKSLSPMFGRSMAVNKQNTSVALVG